jgi:MFS family permease
MSNTKQSRRVALASVMGTTIEYYDFFIYGTASALVFGALFFPSFDPAVATLLSFSTFAVAFIARPIGAIVIGHFGDRIGRKSMLVFTLMAMGGTTLLVGLLPSYDSIGIFAPIILVVLRFVQGFALGGEYGGAVLMTVEHAPKDRRGSLASMVQLGAPIGLILANVAFFVLAPLDDHSFATWGWRFPFILSIVLVLIGVVVRMQITESPSFEKVRSDNQVARMPVVEVLRHHTGRVLATGIVSISIGVVFYVGAVFGLSYGIGTGGHSRNAMLGVVIVSMVAVVAGIIIFGRLADTLGPRRVFLLGSAGTVLGAFPFILALDSANIWITLLGYLALFVPYSALWAPLSSFLAACFDTRIRYTGLSLGFTLGQVVGSAFAPIVATSLLERTGGLWSVGLYIVAATVISAIAALTIRETRLATEDQLEPVAI